MLIKFTYVDAVTGVSMLHAPCANGPVLPAAPGITIDFSNESEWPCSYPIFYGRCNDGADVETSGLIDMLTQELFDVAQSTEISQREIKVAQSEQRRRQSMTCRALQIRKALSARGVRAEVEEFISGADQDTRDTWEFEVQFRRLDPLVISLAAVLERSDEFMDDLFSLAAAL